MKKLLLTFFILYSVASYAEIVRKSKGYGINKEDAILDAKRNAILQATGEYISSSTILENNNLDIKTITLVDGVVNNYEIIKDYDEKSNEIIIKCYIKRNNISSEENQDNFVKLDTSKLDELEINNINKNKAIDELFSDSSKIYDVKVKKIEANVINFKRNKPNQKMLIDLSNNQRINGEKFIFFNETEKLCYYCYYVDVEITLNKIWENRFKLLESVIGKDFLVKRFGDKGYFYIVYGGLSLYDKEKNIYSTLIETRVRDFFLFGKKIRYSKTHKICSKEKYESFNFILTYGGLIDISKTRKLQDDRYITTYN